MLRIARDLSIDENDLDISFVRASGSGRAERQQALDRRAIAVRHAPDRAAGRCCGAAGAARRPAHDQGRRDRHSRAAFPHPGAQPERRDRAPGRAVARSHDPPGSAAADPADVRVEETPARGQKSAAATSRQSEVRPASTTEAEPGTSLRRPHPPEDRKSS